MLWRGDSAHDLPLDRREWASSRTGFDTLLQGRSSSPAEYALCMPRRDPRLVLQRSVSCFPRNLAEL